MRVSFSGVGTEYALVCLACRSDPEGIEASLREVTPEQFAHKRDVLYGHCADIGRDPKEIRLSAHLRLEPDRNYTKVVEDAAGLAAEGLDLGIVYIAPPHDPAVLEPLAEAIRDSGLIT